MDPIIRGAIPVLPAADTTESLRWWTEICGFKETFRDATPPNYAGINRGEAYLHIAGMRDKELARKVGDQTMVRIAVQGIEAMYAEYQKRGGKVHPNGALQTKPWGTKEFGAVDPNGVCVTFQELELLISLIAAACLSRKTPVSASPHGSPSAFPCCGRTTSRCRRKGRNESLR